MKKFKFSSKFSPLELILKWNWGCNFSLLNSQTGRIALNTDKNKPLTSIPFLIHVYVFFFVFILNRKLFKQQKKSASVTLTAKTLNKNISLKRKVCIFLWKLAPSKCFSSSNLDDFKKILCFQLFLYVVCHKNDKALKTLWCISKVMHVKNFYNSSHGFSFHESTSLSCVRNMKFHF